VSTELIFIVVSVLVAGLILVAGLVAVLAGQRPPRDADLQPVGPGWTGEGPARDKYVASPESARPLLGLGGDRYRSTLRALWWATIAGVLISVGLADVYPDNQFQIYALGGLSVIAVVVFH